MGKVGGGGGGWGCGGASVGGGGGGGGGEKGKAAANTQRPLAHAVSVVFSVSSCVGKQQSMNATLPAGLLHSCMHVVVCQVILKIITAH